MFTYCHNLSLPHFPIDGATWPRAPRYVGNGSVYLCRWYLDLFVNGHHLAQPCVTRVIVNTCPVSRTFPFGEKALFQAETDVKAAILPILTSFQPAKTPSTIIETTVQSIQGLCRAAGRSREHRGPPSLSPQHCSSRFRLARSSPPASPRPCCDCAASRCVDTSPSYPALRVNYPA